MSKCHICDQNLGEMPMSFGSASPAELLVPESEFEGRVIENADQCIVDEKHFFVRGHIEIPVTDMEIPFVWSVWVSLSEISFNHMSERWNINGRENDPPYFGWLMTILPYNPTTEHLKTSVQSQPVGIVPLITIEPNEHPLSKEQHNGITMKRVKEIVHQVLH